MRTYLVQVAYTPEAWANMVRNPQNREDLVRPAVEALGGALHHVWFCFGDYDVVALVDMPEEIDAAAFAMGVVGAGAVKAFKTTPLMTADETVEAMRKAGKMAYRPPAG